jgi:hypothetical protein
MLDTPTIAPQAEGACVTLKSDPGLKKLAQDILGPSPLLDSAATQDVQRYKRKREEFEEIVNEEDYLDGPDLPLKKRRQLLENDPSGAAEPQWIVPTTGVKTKSVTSGSSIACRLPGPGGLRAQRSTAQPTPTDPPCGHSIHPAYKSTYKHPRCPACRMVRAVIELHNIDEHIKKHRGSVTSWQELTNDPSLPFERRVREGRCWHELVRGGDARHEIDVIPGHHDSSHRYAKIRLKNLVQEIRRLRKQEIAWEDAHDSSVEGLPEEEMRLIRGRSASVALRFYGARRRHDPEKPNVLTVQHVEEECAKSARKRSRDWEVSTDAYYPKDDWKGEMPQGRWKMTPEQQTVIEWSNVPHIEAAERIAEAKRTKAPPRKKRRTEARVSFDPQVYLCSEADVDKLRIEDRHASLNVLESVEQDSRPNMAPSTKAPTVFAPKRPYTTEALNEGPYDKAGRFIRHRHDFWARKWKAPKGMETVDTSGCSFKQDFKKWDEYVQSLQNEAKKMDEQDALRRATEQEQASALITPLASSWETTEAINGISYILGCRWLF